MKTSISRVIICGAALSLFMSMQAQAQGTDAERQAIVNKINEYRTSIGLPALSMWHDNGCADRQAKQDMESNNPHGTMGMCGERAQNTNPNYSSIEQATTVGLKQMWDEGPAPAGDPCQYPSKCYTEHGHYLNMTGNYKEVAVGIHQANGRVWVNTNFR